MTIIVSVIVLSAICAVWMRRVDPRSWWGVPLPVAILLTVLAGGVFATIACVSLGGCR